MAREFDGTDDYLVSAAALNMTSLQALSVYFEAYHASFGTGQQRLLQIGGGTSPGTFLLIPHGSSGKYDLNIYSNASAATVLKFTRPSAAAWHKYLFQLNCNGNGGFPVTHILVDGGEVSGVETTGSTNYTAHAFLNVVAYLMSADGTQLFSAGRLRQLAIWNGTIAGANSLLNGTNETNLFASGVGAVSITPTFYWKIKGLSSPEPATNGSTALTVSGTTYVDGPDGAETEEGSLIGLSTDMSGGFQSLSGF